MYPKTGKQKRIYESFTSDDPTLHSLMCIMIKDIITQKIIDSVSQETIRKPRQKEDAKAISPKTAKNELGLLTAVLNYYNVEYYERKIRLPAIPEKKIDLPEPENIFRAVRGTEIELLVLLAMWLSFTQSEIASLTKSKSILGNGTYTAVNKVILTINGHEIVKDIHTHFQENVQPPIKLLIFTLMILCNTKCNTKRKKPSNHWTFRAETVGFEPTEPKRFN